MTSSCTGTPLFILLTVLTIQWYSSQFLYMNYNQTINFEFQRIGLYDLVTSRQTIILPYNNSSRLSSLISGLKIGLKKKSFRLSFRRDLKIGGLPLGNFLITCYPSIYGREKGFQDFSVPLSLTQEDFLLIGKGEYPLIVLNLSESFLKALYR